MKLIKYIPVAIFSCVVFASCNSNDEQDGKVITNKPISYSTVGTRLANDKFEEGDVFSVWANYSNDGETETYFSDQQVTLTENVWTPNKTCYWPMDGKLDFYAVCPSPAVINSPESGNNIEFTMGAVPTLRYQIGDFMEDLDLVVAKSPAIACPSDQLVPLHFKHVLGKIRLQVTNDCEYGIPLDVRVKSLEIKAKAHAVGVFDWESMTMVAEDEQLKPMKYVLDEAIDIPARKTVTIDAFYVIPGVVKDFTVEVEWQILNGGIVADRYKVPKDFSSEYLISSGSVKDINFILRRIVNADDDGGGDVEIGN